MDQAATQPVVFLPGSVLPGHLAYAGLVEVLGARVEPLVKELEVYRGPTPPDHYSLNTEVEGVLRDADARGWSTFHLVGYSGGGSSALAVVAEHGDRVRSLALLEPAWAGRWDWTPEHATLWQEYAALEALPPEEFMAAFRALSVKDGVELPPNPPGPPPPWMAQRPAGIAAFLQTFRIYDLQRASLEAFGRPVYYALGGLSSAVQFEELAERLAKVFPDFTMEVFAERHHFDPPHRAEPDRLAASLLALWDRS